MKFFQSLAATLIVATLAALPAHSQNGLKDIPDTAVSAQLEAFQLIEGAKVNLFANEPAVANPTHMNWDSRGRLWVVSSPLYPHIKPGQEEQDKVVILEDTNGDGVADKSIDFATNLHIPTAVLPGDGGAYIANSIEVLFLKDTDGDDVADERQVVLSGFGTEDTHHLLHTFKWGPEGMIWMNQSIYIHTHLETPYGIRRLLGGGMWHYRPETQRSDVFMKGLINPWGHAFDEWGQSFLTDGAGSQGINFVFPRSVFATSPGASRILKGLNPGQPKHCGAEFLTGRHLPDDLKGLIAAPDFRGSRINLFKLTDNGSAYTSSQVPDLISSKHRAFRPIDIKMGPDGAIYVADWYNPIIQHGEVDFRDSRRDQKHGRIWRITFDDQDTLPIEDLSQLDEKALAGKLNAPEALTRQLALTEMRNRDPKAVLPAVANLSVPDGVDPDLVALRKVWASQTLNQFDEKAAVALLDSKNHKARAAALRAIYYRAADNDEALAIASKAIADPHPQVRLWAVSVLAQLDVKETVTTAMKAIDGVELDEFLDFALWSICREHSDRWVADAQEKNPFSSTRQLLFAVRAINKPVAVDQILSALESGEISSDQEVTDIADWISKTGSPENLNNLFVHTLKENASPAHQKAILTTLASAGRIRKIQPTGDKNRLNQFLDSKNDVIFSEAATLAGLWKLESARPGLQSAFLAAAENQGRAEATLNGLISLGGPPTAKLFDSEAKSETSTFLIKSLAVRGRTRMNPAAGATLAVEVLQNAPDGKDPHGIYAAFLATKQGPGALAKALTNAKLPQPIALVGVQKASSAATKPEGLVKALQKAADLKPMKMALSDTEMESMMEAVAKSGDPHNGEKVYRRASMQCLVCHAIGGAGGVIGPDLVSIGSSAPVDYLIDSLLQPNMKIKEGYHTTLVTLKNGDSFAGAIAREDDNELVVRDATGKENRIPKADIASNNISPVSLMPPGLTAQLREDEFVDLVAFLAQLGKDGDFKTPPNRYVRQWQSLMPHERTRDAIGHYGHQIFTEDIKTYQWIPFFAKVTGGVPIPEMPKVVGRGRNRYGVARTFVDVSKAGPVRFKISGKLNDLILLHGENKIELPADVSEAEITLEVKKPGRQKITVSGLNGFGLDDVKVEVLDDAGTVQFIDIKEF
ncbi:c-type cytochrome [Verrucomicrobiales bacterium]|nr:c-type cytochrome [Verrucomicrobiales bacterium]